MAFLNLNREDRTSCVVNIDSFPLRFYNSRDKNLPEGKRVSSLVLCGLFLAQFQFLDERFNPPKFQPYECKFAKPVSVSPKAAGAIIFNIACLKCETEFKLRTDKFGWSSEARLQIVFDLCLCCPVMKNDNDEGAVSENGGSEGVAANNIVHVQAHSEPQSEILSEINIPPVFAMFSTFTVSGMCIKAFQPVVNIRRFQTSSRKLRPVTVDELPHREAPYYVGDYVGRREVVNADRQTCLICLENLLGSSILSTICGHVYHRRCLLDALEYNMCCPHCRKKLDPGWHWHPIFLSSSYKNK